MNESNWSARGRRAAGIAFVGAGIFNATVTRRDRDRVFAKMACDAWLAPWRWGLGRVVVPHAEAVLTLTVGFEISAGLCMLGHGRVARAGLLAGAAWAVITTPALPPPQAIGNLAIAPALVALARRVD